MVLNYHELTMSQPRDSPERRQQFLVICAIMASIFGHSCLHAGLLTPCEIQDNAIFPGGYYLYKYMRRDYAASSGLERTVAKDATLRDESFGDVMYSVFLDSESLSNIPAPHRRFYSGLLIQDHELEPLQKKLLQERNALIPDKPEDLNDSASFGGNIKYQLGDFPSVDAAVMHFPHTGGFISALIFDFRLLPKLVKYGKAHSEPGHPIVIASTCSPTQRMCTHYVPLVNGTDFYLGLPITANYVKNLKVDDLDLATALKGVMKLLGFRKR